MGQHDVDEAQALPLDTHMNDVIHILLCFNLILLLIHIIQPFCVLEICTLDRKNRDVHQFVFLFIIYVVKG